MPILCFVLVLAALLAPPALPQEHGVFRSGDGGKTWVRAGARLDGTQRVNSLGAAGGRVFAGTDGGIFWSRDEGRTWQKSSVGVRVLRFATAGGHIYGGTANDGLLVSRDGGAGWAPVSGLGVKKIRSLLAAQGAIYAGTDTEGVMVSRDEGMTWTAQNAGLPRQSQIFDMAAAGGTVFVGLYNKGLYGWNERDARWVAAGDVRPLALAAGGGRLAIGHNPGGIRSSERPGSAEWQESRGGFAPAAPVWAMASDGGLMMAGVADGVFRSEDGGRSWVRAVDGLPAKSPGISFLVRGKTVYAGVTIPAAGGK